MMSSKKCETCAQRGRELRNARRRAKQCLKCRMCIDGKCLANDKPYQANAINNVCPAGLYQEWQDERRLEE